MRLLLDTHIFLWAMADDDRLSTEARELMRAADEVNVSAASMPVTARHAALVARLPDHHTDPFDRLLIAQAMAEPLLLLTLGRQLATYSDVVRVV